MPNYILHMLDEKQVSYSTHNNFGDVLPELDIMYMTRCHVLVKLLLM
ncbi:aspartate carbamoyltransferase [Xenorhabdus stockiae]|uniref:Aspartate carbamoyltransferase n=1 Tax=Xenorhabdus stockiae TaxID=351614 RepID=A0A2D0K9A3_9GAMM|nr:aspartate carbamoyltransferase [Xenorhabdus stockiae]PHM65515.1 aspartate carbamoyltransferase [Xenorhabdus sp. KJ12.1]